MTDESKISQEKPQQHINLYGDASKAQVEKTVHYGVFGDPLGWKIDAE